MSLTPLRINSCVLGKPPWQGSAIDPDITVSRDWFLSTSKVDILLSSNEPELKSLVPSKNVTWSSVLSCISNVVSSLLLDKNWRVSTPINLLAELKAVACINSIWEVAPAGSVICWKFP